MTFRVTVGIRFHDLSRIQFLERCLVSVAAQTDVEIDVCIAVQDVEQAGLDLIAEASEKALAYSFGGTLQVLNVINPGGKDLRAELMNHIVRYHYNLPNPQFLTFIDYDDIWFSHALSTLANSLAAGKFAMSYADVHAADVILSGQSFFIKEIRNVFEISTKKKSDLRTGNFLPLHSYMFYTSNIPQNLLEYDETLSRHEDYDVLIRIAASLPVVSSSRSCLIGLYNFYTDYRHCTEGRPVNTMQNPFVDIITSQASNEPAERGSLSYVLCKNHGLEWKSFLGEEV